MFSYSCIINSDNHKKAFKIKYKNCLIVYPWFLVIYFLYFIIRKLYTTHVLTKQNSVINDINVVECNMFLQKFWYVYIKNGRYLLISVIIL